MHHRGSTDPRQHRHREPRRDAATINFYCDRASGEGAAARSVRAIFEEGERIFEASKIRSKSHWQIAVRDRTAIVEIEELA